MKLKKDTTKNDWKQALGCTRTEYVQPIQDEIERLQKLHGTCDNDDLTRDAFNTMARDSAGNLVPKGVLAFYSGDLMSRIEIHGAAEVGLLQNLIDSGTKQVTDNHGMFQVCEEMLNTITSPRILDHGFGAGRIGLAFFASVVDLETPQRVPHLTMVGHSTAYARFLKRSCAKYLAGHDINFCFVDKKGRYEDNGPYDVVISTEVMEHCVSPEDEVKRIASCMRVGGLFYLSTFFNDINGKNPQHLREHNHYQDAEKWFGVVEACGFERTYYDQNGVLKAFRRV